MAATSHTILLYALSTCIHCKRLREFLEEQNYPFDCVYVDKLEGEQRSETILAVRKFNPRVSFPTVVVDSGAHVVVGFKKEELMEVLDK